MRRASNDDRAGFTLLELSIYLTILAALFAVMDRAMPLLMSAARSPGAATEHGVLLDAACDQLRSDLSAGAHIDGTALVTASATWRMDGGWLRRNGGNRISRCTAHWRVDPDGTVEVEIAPRHGPRRIIRVAPARWR
ncbi:MAG: prepilin-type N-terminal cleavage/methylation domain-containing protein [Planctomycetes bacterium]|nr:prepilin-type N-terminal cleavage/methylation domain-containing protein [Planctomycetota bacterium]